MSHKWVISCEHGGNHIPAVYATYFQDAAIALQSHRGYDPGALELFHLLAGQLADFSHYSETSRLLIELNRSLHHKNLFSSYTKSIPDSRKKEIIAAFYLPYRRLIEDKIGEFIRQQHQVIHLSIHSFTPVLNGEVRKADIGLLFDPARQAEKAFCREWKNMMHEIIPQTVIRFNYPYQGRADGFTTYLRRRYSHQYAGIELEVNQQYAGDKVMNAAILQSLQRLKAKAR